MEFLIHHMLQSSARRFPCNEALVDGNERVTYEEVVRQSAGLAQGLQLAGLLRHGLKLADIDKGLTHE